MAHIHASPPCQTFAAPDPTNSSKDPPCHFRNPRDPLRAPRAGGSDCKYRRKALLHDGLVQHLLQCITKRREKGLKFNFSIENPRAALRRRPYMDVSKWNPCMNARLSTVDYCAYGYLYRKSTDIWTSLSSWSPRGVTGSGRCETRCGQGCWFVSQSGRPTFRHFKNLAQHPRDGITGKGATEKLNSIPEDLVREILQASLREWREKGGTGTPILIDLCSGYGSVGKVAVQLGFTVISTDIKDRRSEC